jgi:hypothetical protein
VQARSPKRAKPPGMSISRILFDRTGGPPNRWPGGYFGRANRQALALRQAWGLAA